jgi:hypothetical protein
LLQSPFKELALEFFLDGAAKLFVPISTQDAEEFGRKLEGTELKSLKAKEAWMHFLNEAEEHATAMVRLFDLSDTMLLVGGLLNNYRKLLGRENVTGEFRFAVTLGNVSRVVPFVDSDRWAQFVKQCGLPVFQHREAKLFRRGKRRIDLSDGLEAWTELGAWIALAFGLPQSVSTSARIRGIEQNQNTRFDVDV